MIVLAPRWNGDARDVRPGEQLDWARLGAWLRERLAGVRRAGSRRQRDPEVSQFPGGHSNLTYLVRFGDVEIVVRRPPLGPVPPTAHDMAREYPLALGAAPRLSARAATRTCCARTPSVIGSVFYVMERRRGIVVRAEEPPALADPPARAAV